MNYSPIDNTVDECPKYAERTAAEMGLILCAITYANRNLSDGRIPRVWPKRRFGREGEAAAKELVRLGIWAVRPDGDYEIVGFLEHNRSKEFVATLKAKKQAAGQAGGRASAAARAQAAAERPSTHLNSSHLNSNRSRLVGGGEPVSLEPVQDLDGTPAKVLKLSGGET